MGILIFSSKENELILCMSKTSQCSEMLCRYVSIAFSFKSKEEKLKFLNGINDYVMDLEKKYTDA